MRNRFASTCGFMFGLALVGATSNADIYQWEYINLSDPDQGKRASTMLAPDGGGVEVVPGVNLSGRDLTKAYLSGLFLSGQRNAGVPNCICIDVYVADLSNAKLIGADLTGTSLSIANLAGTDFTDADIRGASFEFADGAYGGPSISLAQLYSTGSYKARDLSGLNLAGNDLSGSDFRDQRMVNSSLSGANLSDATFAGADLSGANLEHVTAGETDFRASNLADARFRRAELAGAHLSDAHVRGADFERDEIGSLGRGGISLEQLYSTASYKERDLSGIQLARNDLSNADFAGHILTDANLNAVLTNADFTDADVRGASFVGVFGLSRSQLYSTASYKSRDLSRIGLPGRDLTGWDFAGQNLTRANFGDAQIIGTDFTAAIIHGARFDRLYGTGISLAQLYSTDSYAKKDLGGIGLDYHDLPGASFIEQELSGSTYNSATLSKGDFSRAVLTGAVFNDAVVDGGLFADARLDEAYFRFAELTGASFQRANLRGADFADAIVRNADFGQAILSGAKFNRADLTDANFERQQLAETDFGAAILVGANLRGANLANARFGEFSLCNSFFGCSGNWFGFFRIATLTDADLSAADARGADRINLLDVIDANLIRPDGHIQGLSLESGRMLVVRDYDGNPAPTQLWPPDSPSPLSPIAITVDEHFAMDTGGTLRMVFEADAWNSTISFTPGIPVTRGGTLELAFAHEVNPATQLGRTFHLFDWTGVTPTGHFTVSSAYRFDTSSLYTTGEVTLTAIPEPTTVILIALAAVTCLNPRWTQNASVDLEGIWPPAKSCVRDQGRTVLASQPSMHRTHSLGRPRHREAFRSNASASFYPRRFAKDLGRDEIKPPQDAV